MFASCDLCRVESASLNSLIPERSPVTVVVQMMKKGRLMILVGKLRWDCVVHLTKVRWSDVVAGRQLRLSTRMTIERVKL